MADSVRVTITFDPIERGYPWHVECQDCSWPMWRSTEAKASEVAQVHAECGECGGHCGQPCTACLGHCEFYCDECEGHCGEWCDACETNHCEAECSYCEGHCETDDPNCDDCHSDNAHGYESIIHDYTYKPDPIFYGEGKLYVGLELEVSWPDISEGSEWIKSYVERSDFWYAKSDSTVDSGFELVTHPMTLDYGRRHFPYGAIETALRGGAEPDNDSCGTHIHVSRSGLSGRQWWTLFAIHRKLPELCGTVGGRGINSEWAKWEDSGDILSQPVKEKLQPGAEYHGRYVPVNVANKHTIELRYPKGDFTPTGVRRNLQWIDALTTFGADKGCRDLVVTESTVLDHIRSRPHWTELQDSVASYA